MKAPIFINEEQQAQFDLDGFIKVSLLDPRQISLLQQLFDKYYPDPSAGFYSSSFENKYELKKEISNEIINIVSGSLSNVLKNYHLIGAAFLSKGTGPKSELMMHQDWTIVDEDNYYSINVWCPLVSTNQTNGTVEFIKGSHLWHQNIRTPTLPFYYS